MLNGLSEIPAKRAAALLALGAGLAVATAVAVTPAPETTTEALCRAVAVYPAEVAPQQAGELFVTPTCR
ncbi:hypothetical protein OOK13_44275 [Streptomyces sp. NBC_00378]|uniref:hypothetical protein n=1 Tax=unclassified Streptomyces TaxID=2593676 RepID=UPI002251CDB3|nr:MULTISPECIES: hypothetical protein [unclassified Streptomyces]MCX5115330.1 hypothetical protein [Streptomyces sp. NBC_00378]